QIAARLDDSLALLTRGSRTALPRQQTLRATLEWSYALLADRERVVFRRLSAFAGGWTLEAAEAVCAGNAINRHDVPHPLWRLVDQSLVALEEREGQARYRMLEPIRQFAAAQLGESGEADKVRRRHGEWALALAVAASSAHGSLQAVWLDRLER